MQVLPELDLMEGVLADHLPHLRPAQRRGLALWVCGAILAHSACQSAVLAALLLPARSGYHALRQRLREWLYDGVDRAAPCATEIAIEHCFAPLLRWVLAWWRGGELALAIDATARGERIVALVVSVLYRGSALPVAWVILPGNAPGPWLGPILRLLRRLRPAGPAGLTVLVLADRGCGAHGCGSGCATSAGTPCCGSRAASPSRPKAARDAPPGNWCGRVRHGSGAGAWARPTRAATAP
jgi:hypothetical protein